MEGVALSERAAGASHGCQHGLGAVMAQWKFRFDQQYYSTQNPENLSGFAGSAGLTATFSRSEPTVDRTGASVDSNHARFDRPTLVAPLIQDQGLTIGNYGVAPESRVLASGLDADGATPVTVFMDEDHTRLYVISGTNNSVLEWELVETQLVSTTAGAPSLTTYALNTTSNATGPRIVPQSAVIVHGLIVVAGAFLTRPGSGSEYQVAGWGFLMSANGGSTWTFVWADSDQSDAQVGHWRGREWCLRASLAHNSVDHPVECWIASTDYRVQTPDSPSTAPLGGRVTLIRFQRSSGTGADWNWVMDSNGNPFTFYIGPGSGNVTTGCHLHSAHVAEYGAVGLQMIVSVGDAQFHSRFVRFSISDYSQSDDYYTNPANWTVDRGANTSPDGYHGFRQTIAGEKTLPGSRSQQPVGVAVGPRTTTSKPFATQTATRSTLIWGGDEQAEVLTRMVLPEPGDSPNQLWIEHLYGFNTGFGSNYAGSFARLRGLVFSLAQARPEKASVAGAAPLVAVLSNADDETSMTRVLYCPDPVPNAPLWVQLATRWGSSSGTAVLHGTKVYFSAYGDPDSETWGLRSIDVSQLDTTVFKPIIVGPGGKNLAISTCFVETGDQAPVLGSSAGIVALSKNASGIWIDTLPGFAIRKLPSPPSMTSRVFRVRTRRDATMNANRFICRIHLSGEEGQWNQLASGHGWNSNVAQVRRVRCWVLDGSFSVLNGANGQSYPNKTAQMSMRMIDGGDQNPADFKGAPLLFSCSNRWCPLTIVGFRAIDQFADPNEQGIGIELLCSSDTGYDTFPPDDNYLYLAIDGAFDGNGSFPYPMALSVAASEPLSRPDELLTINTSNTDVALGFDQAWTVRLGGILPSGTWDQYAQRTPMNEPDTDLRYSPLFTLWADNANWVEFSANCVTRGFRVTVMANGSTQLYDFGDEDQLWLPESVLMAAISWDSASNPKKLYFGATLANGTLATPTEFGLAVTWGTSVTRFNEIRFRGAPGTGFSGFGEVSEFRWIGGQIDEGATTSVADFKQLFGSIDFLKGP